MQKVKVKITGEQLMQDRIPIEWIEQTKQGGKRKTDSWQVPMEYLIHRNGGKEPCIPSECITRSILEAAKRFDPDRGKGNAVKEVAGGFHVQQGMIPYTYETTSEFTRMVRRKDGNRISKTNPVYYNWSCDFDLLLADWFNIDKAKSILEEAGELIGIMGWRIALRGSFGGFKVEKFKV